MEFESFKGLTEKDLRGKLKELAEANFKARFSQDAQGTNKRTAEVRERKRDIARIMTVLKGRQALARLEAEGKKLEELEGKLGKADARKPQQRAALKHTRDRHKQVQRAQKQLANLK